MNAIDTRLSRWAEAQRWTRTVDETGKPCWRASTSGNPRGGLPCLSFTPDWLRPQGQWMFHASSPKCWLRESARGSGCGHAFDFLVYEEDPEVVKGGRLEDGWWFGESYHHVAGSGSKSHTQNGQLFEADYTQIGLHVDEKSW